MDRDNATVCFWPRAVDQVLDWRQAVVDQSSRSCQHVRVSLEAELGSDRECPNCCERTIPVSRLLVSNYWCRSCGAQIGTHWLYGTLFNFLIIVVTLFSTISILAGQGLYAAILLFPLPIGAIGYLKARFCALETKRLKGKA